VSTGTGGSTDGTSTPDRNPAGRGGATSSGLAERDLRSERIRVVMRREPVVVACGSTLAEGIAAIQAARADCLLVADGEVLSGILTERDLLLKVIGRDVDLGAPVDLFMTATPDALSPEATLSEAIGLMDRGGYRHVPLVDADRHVVGLLRQQDILAYLAEAFPESILNLPPRPHQRLAAQDGA
jgi:CBS domain-containing protein